MAYPDKTEKRRMMKSLEEANSLRTALRRRLKVTAWEMTVRLAYGLKRGLDIMVAVLALIALLPLFGLTALAIFADNPGPVFYRQIRIGKDGRRFWMYKFRSMVKDADQMKAKLAAQNESRDGVLFKIRKDPRITRVGAIIRKFSIDELPQLVNVLKGDMSLVGPRPALPQEAAQYTLEQHKRLHVKPGITCIWQVSGRSEIPFNEQVNLDLEYIGSANLFQDIMILLKTIPAVLTGKGAY
jgi:lipopolysaccharide/colanic/teichoic acid biosynthesis glycosyltransferase